MKPKPKQKKMLLALDEDLYKQIQVESLRTEFTKTEVVRRIISEHFAKGKTK